MQAVNLLTSRYNQLVTAYSRFYATHPDAEVYNADYRVVLARSMAAKIAYGVTYDDELELTLLRLNRWRADAAPLESQE